jgi:putative tricarboxylic transport membrane protein
VSLGVTNLESTEKRDVIAGKVGGLWLSKEQFKAAWPAVPRGTGTGSILGLLPGGGAMLASFASYALEKKVAKDPSRFGRGAIQGVAGPQVMSSNPGLFRGLVTSMWIGNLMLVVLNLPLIGIWIKLLEVPDRGLYPAMLLFCAIGVYSINNTSFEFAQTAVFGFLGVLFFKLECEPAPLLLGFVLGPMMEENLRRAMLLSRGDPTTFVTRPLSAAMLTAAALLLILIVVPNLRRKREEVFEEGEN